MNRVRSIVTPEENNTIVAARGLGRRVTTAAGPLDILSDIDLGIKAAESVAIVGVSGSGKSTLLGLLAGLDLPSSGEVWLAGQRLNDLDEDGRARVRGQLTGFVFQSFQLLESLTALENVMLPLELSGSPHARQQARELLARGHVVSMPVIVPVIEPDDEAPFR